MKKNFKNLMALVLTGAMLTAGTAAFAAVGDIYTGGSLTSQGASNTISGSGSDITVTGATMIEVTVPTTGFNFWLDPNGIMSLFTDGDAEFESGASVYFASEYDDPYATTPVVTKYGSTSAPKLFTNKGLMPVNIKAVMSTTGGGTSGASKMETMEASSFDGTKAGIALSAGMVNKDGKVIAPLKPITGDTATEAATVYSVIEDSRGLYEVGKPSDATDDFTLAYTTSADASEFAQTGIFMKGEIDVAYDWSTALKAQTVKPASYVVNTAYELSELSTTLVKMADLTESSKNTSLTLNGVKKAASKDPGTTEITIKFIESPEMKGTSLDLGIADLEGNVIVKSDNTLEFTQKAWKDLYKMAGDKGVVTMMISAPGASGVLVTLR